MQDEKRCLIHKENNRYLGFVSLFSWKTHQKTWIKNNLFPVLTIKYEDLQNKTFDTFKEVINFIKSISKSNKSFDREKAKKVVQSCEFEKMKTMAEELKNSLDVAGHALPMPLFASEQAQPAEIEMGAVVERMESQPTPPAPEPVPVEEVSLPEPKTESVPLPTESVPIPSESVPLPSLGSVPLPTQDEEIAQETGFKNEMEVDYAAQDAFAGAFGSQLVPEAQSAPESIESDHKAIPESHEEVEALTPEVVEEVRSDPIPLVDIVLTRSSVSSIFLETR